jgi:hypothetical protein
MPLTAHIQLADIRVLQSYKDSVTFSFPTEYKSFIKDPGPNDIPVDIRIEISREPFPDNRGKMTKLFDTEESWSVYINESEQYIFVLSPPALSGRTVWSARCSRDFRDISIFLNDPYAYREDADSEMLTPFSYPLDQLLLMFYLSRRNGAIIHAAGLALGGKGYMFPGKSGAGKSTLSQQFLGDTRYDILSDDRIIIRNVMNAFRQFGTPWPGEAGIAVNTAAPLEGIFFLSKSEAQGFEEISRREAVERLLPVVSIPWYDKKVMTEIMDFCDDLAAHVPAHIFHFRPEPGIADIFEEFVSR